jgi:hypothetical protein
MTDAKSPAPLFLGIFLLALISVAGLWLTANRLGSSANLDLKKIFLVPPDSLKLLYGVETKSGVVAEFFDPSSRHKFALARAPTSEGSLPQVAKLLAEIMRYQSSRTVPAGTNPFLLKFISAQFDGRRAYEISNQVMTVPENAPSGQVLTFMTNRGANYAVTILQDSGDTTVVIAMLKDSAVDLKALGTFVALLQSSPAPAVSHSGL